MDPVRPKAEIGSDPLSETDSCGGRSRIMAIAETAETVELGDSETVPKQTVVF